MSGHKAAATPFDVALLAFVLLILTGLMFAIYYGNIIKVIKSSYTIHYSTDLNEFGTELVNILKHQKDYLSNMELLGRDTILGYSGNTMEYTLEKVYSSKIPYDMMLDYDIGFLFHYGKPNVEDSIKCISAPPGKFMEDGKPKFTLEWPATGVSSDSGVITSLQGPRYIFESCNCHTGMDFGFRYGTPIRAVYSGEVVFAGWYGESIQDPHEGYGILVKIKHWIIPEDRGKKSADFYTYYAHLKKGSLVVNAGDWVEAGKTIAQTGNTGRSTGAHLHLELRDYSNPDTIMNPCIFLKDKPIECQFFTNDKPTICGIDAKKIPFDVPIPGAILGKTKGRGVLYKWVV